MKLSFWKSVTLPLWVLFLCGCEGTPDPGLPRAPLPGEVKILPPSTGPMGPRSLGEAREAIAAAKAKAAAARANSKGAEPGTDSGTVDSKADQRTSGAVEPESAAPPPPVVTPQS
jgi:hypothetical protein